MWRLLFSKYKLTVAEKTKLENILDDSSYTCEVLCLPDRLQGFV